MTTRDALEHVVAGGSLDEETACTVMGTVLHGECDPAWIAGWLVALRMKGETVDEIAGFARAMRACAVPLQCAASPLVDTCGTGGDAAGTFNISTTAAFVVAGAGGYVAKHGNRSVSSRCGSADVLEALGAELMLAPELVAACIEEVGFGFLFAPRYHGAMRHAVAPRKALALRTVFNLLGPLTNPAGAPYQLLGVYDSALLPRLAGVLPRLGLRRGLLVHGHDGLDELTVTAESSAVLVDGEAAPLTIRPEDVGLPRHPTSALRGGDAAENARILRQVLRGEAGAARDVTLLNAGAALWTCGRAVDLRDGVSIAAAAIDSGRAQDVLRRYLVFTQKHGGTP